MAHYTFMAKHRNFSCIFPVSLGTERRARNFEMSSLPSCRCQAGLHCLLRPCSPQLQRRELLAPHMETSRGGALALPREWPRFGSQPH